MSLLNYITLPLGIIMFIIILLVQKKQDKSTVLTTSKTISKTKERETFLKELESVATNYELIGSKSNIEMNYKDWAPNYYSNPPGYQIHRISIKNLSQTESIKNVKVKFIDMEPMHGVFEHNRPVLLRFMGDEKPLKKSIDLHPDEEVFVDVIIFESLGLGNVIFTMLTSEQKDTAFSFDSNDTYKITIQASGENTKTVTMKFQFGINANDVGGDWQLWFKPIN